MEESRMPLTEHLSELRKRIMVSLAAVTIVFVVVFNYSEFIFSALTLPMRTELQISVRPLSLTFIKKPGVSLVFLAPAEAFWMHLKISFMSAVVVALPVLFAQVWGFIAPGLLPKEKKYVIPFIVVATGMFLLGAAFCYLIVLPFALSFLLGYKTPGLTPMISVGSYIDFCLKFILAFGVVFELPLVIAFLARLGFVTPRFLAKNRRFAILFAFIIAAVLTPTPDAFNQTLMAIPIILLYEVGILLARVLYRKKVNG